MSTLSQFTAGSNRVMRAIGVVALTAALLVNGGCRRIFTEQSVRIDDKCRAIKPKLITSDVLAAELRCHAEELEMNQNVLANQNLSHEDLSDLEEGCTRLYRMIRGEGLLLDRLEDPYLNYPDQILNLLLEIANYLAIARDQSGNSDDKELLTTQEEADIEFLLQEVIKKTISLAIHVQSNPESEVLNALLREASALPSSTLDSEPRTQEQRALILARLSLELEQVERSYDADNPECTPLDRQALMQLFEKVRSSIAKCAQKTEFNDVLFDISDEVAESTEQALRVLTVPPEEDSREALKLLFGALGRTKVLLRIAIPLIKELPAREANPSPPTPPPQRQKNNKYRADLRQVNA